MGSFDIVFFRSLSVEKLLIEIWDFSNHVHCVRPTDTESCNCRHYLNLCIEAVKKQWRDNFTYFDTTMYRFQFHKKELIDIISIEFPVVLEHYIRCYITNVWLFFKKKVIDHCYSLVPVEQLCMQIIYHSMHLKTISDKKNCNCQVFIDRCIFKAKKTVARWLHRL